MSWAMICNASDCRVEAGTSGWCTQHDTQPLRTWWRAADLVEELEWLIGTDWPDNIARRLGYKSSTVLERRLYVIARTHTDLSHAAALARRLHNHHNREYAA